MSAVSATLILYRDCARDAFKGLARSAWAVAALVIAYGVTLVAALIFGPFGLAGGFVLGLLEAVIVGWYLALVEIGVGGRRRVTFDDLRSNVGSYWVNVISVMFIFWIGSFLLQVTVPTIVPVAVGLCTLLFNPAPEMIYTDQTGSTALLQDALSFMQENWPEWLGGVVLGGGFLAGWGYVVFGGLDAELALALVQSFGPFFGFVHMAGIAMVSLTASGFVGAAVLLVFTHFFLLFRGNLYKRLRHSSRRSRAWQARVR